ncbi:MAG: hypothetical protein ACOYT9_02920 [Patescibacteria group bacterium]
MQSSTDIEVHRSTFEQFERQIGHLYLPQTVKGLFEQSYQRIPPIPGFGFVTTHLERPIEPKTLNRKVKIQAIINELGHEYFDFASNNPDLASHITLVEQYGAAQFKGSDSRNISIPLLSTLVDCLGIIIKDESGNITTAHISPFEQYNIHSVVKFLYLHLSQFGNPSSVRIAIAGMSNLEKTRQKIAPISILPPTLKSFTKEELEILLSTELTTLNVKVQLYESSDIREGKMSVYDLASTTNPNDPIVAKKYIIAAPANY